MRVFIIICWCLGALWTITCAIFALPGFLLNERVGHWIHRMWGRGLCLLVGAKVEIQNIENLPRNEGVIIAPNHESMFDMFILSPLPINYKWIAKTQFLKFPLIGWVMWAMGCYFVRRDQSEHDLRVMKQVEERLRTGTSVTIFPEGTRTRTGELLPFKKGPFKIAQNVGTRIVPIAIIGTRAIAPAGRLPDKFGHHVILRIGKPMSIPRNVPLTESMEDFRRELIALLGDRRQTKV